MYGKSSSTSSNIGQTGVLHGVTAAAYSLPKILNPQMTLDNFFRPSFYCQPFVHWIPGQCGFEEFGGIPAASLGKHRRNRTAFSQQQLAVLERAFTETQYPDLETRDQLSRSTGLPETKIQVWFKNRRAKQRKLQKSKEKPDACCETLEKSKDCISSTSSLLFCNVKKEKFGKPSEELHKHDEESDISVGHEDIQCSSSRLNSSSSSPPLTAAKKLPDQFSETEGASEPQERNKHLPSLQSSRRSTERDFVGKKKTSCSLMTAVTLPSHVSPYFHASRVSSSCFSSAALQETSQCVPVVYPHSAAPWPLMYYGGSSHLCAQTNRYPNALSGSFANYASDSDTEYECFYGQRN